MLFPFQYLGFVMECTSVYPYKIYIYQKKINDS